MKVMSSLFPDPDSDTFLNHFEYMLTHFKPPDHLSWSQVFVVESDLITWGIPQLIQKVALIPAVEYEKRFDELLSTGYDWINMNAKGILNDAFIVEIDYPRYTNLNAPRNKVSVNFSGPATIGAEPEWNLSNSVKIIE